jgi:hypothetical protein
LARKKQFEGPKSYLEYSEGAAGPKEAIRIQFRPKNSHIGAKDKAVEKLYIYSAGTEERSEKNLEKKPSRQAV